MSTPNSFKILPSARPRVLLVDDNDAANKGLAKILEALGFHVTVVLDGASALRALQSEPPPDFVLTDLRLPDIDGREVARQASRLVPPPRVALITGWDLEGGDRDSAVWGIDWVFPKPLNVYELVSRLREAWGEDHESAQPPSDPGQPPAESSPEGARPS